MCRNVKFELPIYFPWSDILLFSREMWTTYFISPDLTFCFFHVKFKVLILFPLISLFTFFTWNLNYLFYFPIAHFLLFFSLYLNYLFYLLCLAFYLVHMTFLLLILLGAISDSERTATQTVVMLMSNGAEEDSRRE